MKNTVITLSADELWLIQRYLRHELHQQRDWTAPPASLELNNGVAAALYFCWKNEQTEASIEVTLDDLLALDYVIPQDAKDINGKLVGKVLLLKTYEARVRLTEGDWPFLDADEPAVLSKDHVTSLAGELLE